MLGMKEQNGICTKSIKQISLTGSMYIGCTGTCSWLKNMASATTGSTQSKHKDQRNLNRLQTIKKSQ